MLWLCLPTRSPDPKNFWNWICSESFICHAQRKHHLLGWVCLAFRKWGISRQTGDFILSKTKFGELQKSNKCLEMQCNCSLTGRMLSFIKNMPFLVLTSYTLFFSLRVASGKSWRKAKLHNSAHRTMRSLLKGFLLVSKAFHSGV